MSQHISEQLRQRIRDSADNRCGYCLSPQNLVLGTLGKTACGRATVIAMRLNNIVAVTVRQHWVAAGWHPPQG